MDLIPPKLFEKVLRDELQTLLPVLKKHDLSDALAMWVAEKFLDLDASDARKACAIQGAGDSGVDLFTRIDGRKLVVVGQAECAKDLNLAKSFSPRILTKLDTALRTLNDPSTASNHRHRLFRAAQEYIEARRKGWGIELWAIVAGKQGRGLKNGARSFRISTLRHYSGHTLRVIDAGALLAKYCNVVEQGDRPDIELVVTRSETRPHGRDAWHATVTGQSIAEAVRDVGLGIFEMNARLPLIGAPVNAEMKRTLENPSERRLFWHYNNGMTILCDKLIHASSGPWKLEGAQIVNGCQTGSTLKDCIDALDDVTVPCKIIVGASPELGEAIRKTTNRQTSIKERDLRSGDPIQKILQHGFQALGYFYERKNQEIANADSYLGKIYVREEFPKGQFKNELLAQRALAFWHQKPASAKMEKEMIFRKEADRSEGIESGYYDIVFHRGVSVDEMLLPYLIYHHLHLHHKVGVRTARRGFDYMVLNHGKETVLALIGHLLRSRYSIEPHKHWTAERALQLGKLADMFENPAEHEDYLKIFCAQTNRMLIALKQWVRREIKRRRREGLSTDIRDLLVADGTFASMLDSTLIDRSLIVCKKALPMLT